MTMDNDPTVARRFGLPVQGGVLQPGCWKVTTADRDLLRYDPAPVWGGRHNIRDDGWVYVTVLCGIVVELWFLIEDWDRIGSRNHFDTRDIRFEWSPRELNDLWEDEDLPLLIQAVERAWTLPGRMGMSAENDFAHNTVVAQYYKIAQLDFGGLEIWNESAIAPPFVVQVHTSDGADGASHEHRIEANGSSTPLIHAGQTTTLLVRNHSPQVTRPDWLEKDYATHRSLQQYLGGTASAPLTYHHIVEAQIDRSIIDNLGKLGPIADPAAPMNPPDWHNNSTWRRWNGQEYEDC